VVAEPTFEGVGKFIREVAINSKLNSKFSSQNRINLYAENRYDLLTKFIIPALKDGKNVYSSRNITSSLVYQSTELDCSFSNIVDVFGNRFAMNNLADNTIISAISINKSMDNLSKREKQDDAFFEERGFQERILKKYLSSELKAFLESNGTKVHYIDIPEDSSAEDTIYKSKELLKELLYK
jgi:thymidylate kinase